MTTQQLDSNLAYVRGVVEGADEGPTPAPIYFLWAVLIPVGFALADFAPNVTGLYWLIVGPLGGVASWVIGWRMGPQLGRASRREAKQQTLHWGGMMGAILLAVLMVVAGDIDGDTAGKVIVLVVALAYFTSGIYLDRTMLWLGLLMAAAYVALLFIEGPVWTIAGVVIGLGLLAGGVRAKRIGAAHAAHTPSVPDAG